jgi:quinol monooxygenase YgiN
MQMAFGGAGVRDAVTKRAKTTTPVCVVIRAEARPGAEAELSGLLADFAFKVRAGERGCLAYVVTHELGAPTRFAAHARFADWAAFERHAVTPHMNRAMARLNALLATPVSLEIFLEI